MLICDDIHKKLEEVRQDPYYIPLIDAIKNEYEKTKGKTTADLDFSSFNLFFETGNRSVYEERYYERRKRLTWSAILYLLYEKQEYLDELCNMIWLICGEITWVLPAHLHIENNKAGDYRTYIDLFAAETGFYLSEVNYLLKGILPEKVSQMIECQVKERILDSYENRSFWWETLESNWSAVCAGSVGMSYMYMAPDRFEKVKDRILKSLDYFLKGYGEDGCCGEGISYWHYGFGYYIQFADMYYRFTNGVCDIRHSKKTDNIAKFLSRVFLRNNTVVSFADGVMYSEFIDIGLVSYLVKNYSGVSATETVLKITNSSFPHKLSVQIRNLLWSDSEILKDVGKIKEGTDYFPDAKWYIAKKGKYSFAAKAGHNDEGHNHNDVGAFIFADDLGQIIADVGAMEYTRDNFNEKRYTFLNNSSLGHSVPIVDGKPQNNGMEYCGKVLNVSDKEFVMEIQDAYDTSIEKIIRSFEIRDNGVILKDLYWGAEGHSISERFISVTEPVVVDGGVRIGDVTVIAEGKISISRRLLTHTVKDDFTVFLTDFEVVGDEFKAEISKQ